MITAFRHKDHFEQIATLCDDGNYRTSAGVKWSLQEHLNAPHSEIYAVRRKRDNLEFTIDEVVVVEMMCFPTEFKIKSFKEHERSLGGVACGGEVIAEFPKVKSILVTLQQYGIERELQVDISQLTKKKEVLPTTDGMRDEKIFSVNEITKLITQHSRVYREPTVWALSLLSFEITELAKRKLK